MSINSVITEVSEDTETDSLPDLDQVFMTVQEKPIPLPSPARHPTPTHPSADPYSELRPPLRNATRAEIIAIIARLYSDNDADVGYAAESLGQLASTSPIGIESIYKDAIIRAGAIPPLVSLLSSFGRMVALWSLYAIAQIINKNPLGVEALMRANGLPALVSFLSSSNETEALFATGAVGSIAGTNITNKIACVSAGAVPALAGLLLSHAPRQTPTLRQTPTPHQPDHLICAINALMNIVAGNKQCVEACCYLLPMIESRWKHPLQTQNYAVIAKLRDTIREQCVKYGVCY